MESNISSEILENGRPGVRDFRLENSKMQIWDDLDRVLWANLARRRTPPPQNSIQNFETFSYTRNIMTKPSKYGVVTQNSKILTANHGMANQMPNHHRPGPYVTKNAFVQTMVETKPRRVAAVGGGSGGLVLNSGNFVVILIILLLLLAGSLAALTFMTFRYKKILERQNHKPIQPAVITKLITVDDKCQKKGIVLSN